MQFSLAGILIPVWWLLILYGVFLTVFLLYSAFNLYHLVRFGTISVSLYGVIALFIGGTLLLVGMTVLLLLPYDWYASFSLSDLFRQTANTRMFQGI